MPLCLRIKGSVGIQALLSYSPLYSPFFFFLHLNKAQFARSCSSPHHEPPLLHYDYHFAARVSL